MTYPHTAECRDEFCVHPIQCERDGTCPPSVGGEVQAGLAWADIRAMYAAVADVKPIEPIKLTQAQLEWLKNHVDVMPPATPWPVAVQPPLATPIVIVNTVQESTPYMNGWDWPDLEIDPKPFASGCPAGTRNTPKEARDDRPSGCPGSRCGLRWRLR